MEGNKNLLEILLRWKDTAENCVYLVQGIKNQFPWVLPYINLHRDLFFDIKRPVVVVVNEYEIKEIQKHAPDWFRFRSRTYEIKKEESGGESYYAFGRACSALFLIISHNLKSRCYNCIKENENARRNVEETS